jgi:hypothetical protein
MVAESEEAQTQDSGAIPGMEGVKAARILDYKVLAARQWQLAENLSVPVFVCHFLVSFLLLSLLQHVCLSELSGCFLHSNQIVTLLGLCTCRWNRLADRQETRET